jgi:hypothetical protein
VSMEDEMEKVQNANLFHTIHIPDTVMITHTTTARRRFILKIYH